MKSQVLRTQRTAQAMHQEGPKRRPKRPRPCDQETFAKMFSPAPSKIQALADSIKSFEERKDSNGKDTFVLSDWWKANGATLPGFTYVLRAVLTNSPNS